MSDVLSAHQDLPDLERRLTDLQSQINRLSLSVHLWQERQDRLFEQRLTDWNAVEARAQKDATDRLHELQRTIEHEWQELRHLHEDPLQPFRQIETNIGERLSELSDQVHAAVIELRAMSGPRPEGLQTTAPSWPLDDVVRLHNQLREAGDAPASGNGHAMATRPPVQLVDVPPAWSERLASLERALSDGQSEIREVAERGTRVSRLGWAAIFLLLIGGAAAAATVYSLRQQMSVATARVTAAEQQAQAASRTATEQIAAARETAAKQIAEARELALKAQMVAGVLAAPDLVRYNLVAAEAGATPSAQVLWSRSGGLVFNGSRVPPAPGDSIYQVWLLTAGEPMSAGTFVPDASGHASMAAPPPSKVAPVVGVSVTLERAGGADRPTGRTVLVRPTPPPAPPADATP